MCHWTKSVNLFLETAKGFPAVSKFLKTSFLMSRRRVTGRWSDLRLAIMILGLILIPSGLLGYFSWRAIKQEQELARERLLESHSRFARLAARKIDDELKRLEKRWNAALLDLYRETEGKFDRETLEQFVKDQHWISELYVISPPGRVLYPTGISLVSNESVADQWQQEAFVRQHDIFSELHARGETLEYEGGRPDSALVLYQRILREVSLPQLRAVTMSCIGRAYMKMGQWQNAIDTYRDLLSTYPEARDLNNLYIRFLAQYQIAAALENMGKDTEALETLLALQEDLVSRSDAVSIDQFEYFGEQIHLLALRLLSSPRVSQAETYRRRLAALTEQGKKRLSQRFFLEILDRRLYRAIVEKKRYQHRFYYISSETAGTPYLIGYCFLPSPRKRYVAGIVGFEVNLQALQEAIFPRLLSQIEASDDLVVGITNLKGEFLFGSEAVKGEPFVTHPLDKPFGFWQVALYSRNGRLFPDNHRIWQSFGAWIVSLLLLSIFVGAFFFARRAMRDAYLSRMKSDFVSSISHEFRTPLSSIKMLAELMEMQLRQAPKSLSSAVRDKAVEYLDIIQRECDRLARLIDNVLDFAKIEKGIKTYTLEPGDPGEVVRNVVEMFRPHALAMDFVLESSVEPSLPPVSMDRDALSQVLLNLLSNAVKYSRDHKVIYVRCKAEQNLVVVEVEDRGIGIPEHEIPRIFDDFYRVDNRLNASTQGGLGLGLTLVRHIVQAHNGRIHVRSRVGQGSIFRVELPAIMGATSRTSPEQSAQTIASVETEVGTTS